MNIKQAVTQVAEVFVYRPDPKLFDYWSVMRVQDHAMHGDCDDFAFTSMWLACDRSVLKLVYRLGITHEYRMIRAITPQGQKHWVGYAENMYFDNWTRQALPKSEFLERTQHKLLGLLPSPLMIVPVVLGFFLRYK